MIIDQSTKLLSNIMEIGEINTKAEAESYLHKIKNLIDVEFFLMGMSVPITMTRSESIIVDNYPAEWRTLYDKNHLKDIDPVVKHCMENSSPVTWGEINILKRSNTINVMEEAKIYDLKFGVSIPIHTNNSSFGMVSFASSEKMRTDNSLAVMASNLVQPLISDFVTKQSQSLRDVHSISLTDRELECLKWSAEGKSAWEISRIICCSERTVIFHISNMCNKLGAANKYQAISKAIISGVMHPEY